MKKLFKLLSVAMLAGIISGCAAPADPTAMAPTQLQQTNVNPAYKSAIQISSVQGGKKTNPAWMSKISNDDFKTALESSLKNIGYYSNAGKLQLDANLLEVKQPIAGFDLTVTTVIDYNLKRADGRSVFRKVITTPYTAAFSDSLIAVTRLKKANEGSVRANIKAFIAALNGS
jgi:hypothetical protein